MFENISAVESFDVIETKNKSRNMNFYEILDHVHGSDVYASFKPEMSYDEMCNWISDVENCEKLIFVYFLVCWRLALRPFRRKFQLMTHRLSYNYSNIPFRGIWHFDGCFNIFKPNFTTRPQDDLISGPWLEHIFSSPGFCAFGKPLAIIGSIRNTSTC